MKRELELKLVDKYPKIFEGVKEKDPRKSLMAFGFECGDGWYDIIDRLCADLMTLGVGAKALQVKEKYGTLRFYCSFTGFLDKETVDLAWERVTQAEIESGGICEYCGEKGKSRGTSWLRTLCNSCAALEYQGDNIA